MTGVLDGVRVLDYGRFIAGPWCAAMLADLGAEVIRVEKIDGGEDREIYPISEDGSGALYLNCNRGKLGITLNPLKPEGREIQEKLIATADVVIANMPPRALKQLGLDYETLKSIKPDIILTTATAFGNTGPYAEKVGLDAVAQAMCGNMYMTGDGEHPMKSYSPWVDYATAAHAMAGTLAALMHRNATGEGQEVQTALLSTAITVANSLLVEQHALGTDRVASGNRSPMAAPSDDFKTKDGHIFATSAGQPMFERWVDLMREDGGDEDHWLTDPRFKDDISRGENSTEVSARMQSWCTKRTTAEALEKLAEARIPAAEIFSPQQTLDNEHVRESGMLTEPIEYPGAPKAMPLVAPPVKLTATPGEVRHRAPQLGEHTVSVLESLGYSVEEVAALKDERVV